MPMAGGNRAGLPDGQAFRYRLGATAGKQECGSYGKGEELIVGDIPEVAWAGPPREGMEEMAMTPQKYRELVRGYLHRVRRLLPETT